MVEEAKRKKKSMMVFKVNFEKAPYDQVRWGFLYYMLRRMGFCEVWINWIKCCVESVTMLVLVNKSPTKEFKGKKGLRKRDL